MNRKNPHLVGVFEVWKALEGLGIQRSPSFAQRVFYQFSLAAHTQFVHHIASMGFHCLDANVQLFSNLSIRRSLGQKLQDLSLAVPDHHLHPELQRDGRSRR